jgi:MSHA pilin protein MshA
MKRSAGFTLIELIIVIVILGILAVTAAPKFMNLQGDARAATVNGLKGAVQAASSMVYSKAIIKGVDKTASSTSVTTDGTTTVTTVYGYPAAAVGGIDRVIDATSSDWDITTTTTAPITYVLTPKGYTPASGSCNVTYTQATSTTVPATVAATVTGC